MTAVVPMVNYNNNYPLQHLSLSGSLLTTLCATCLIAFFCFLTGCASAAVASSVTSVVVAASSLGYLGGPNFTASTRNATQQSLRLTMMLLDPSRTKGNSLPPKSRIVCLAK